MGRAATFAALILMLVSPGAWHAAPGESGNDAAPPAGTHDVESPAPPDLRLPAGVRPARYAVDLSLSPESDTFTGEVAIAVDLAAPRRIVWLNATDLAVREVSIEYGGRTVQGRAIPGGTDFVGLAFEHEIPAGRATLRVAYTGKASARDNVGVFRQKEGEAWYLFTHFEAIDARRAFPCFDEPAYKAPWEITLRVRRDLAAVANTPVASETDLPDGLKAVRFAPTHPLPSYLIAFGVGPFDFAEGPPAGSRGVPFRIVVPRGQREAAAWAVRCVPEILARLEDYFGTPYPFEKLDFLAVPLRPGAMENPGLITFGRQLILAREADDTPSRQRRFARVAAHEMAHMWFGDLVTMAWWDDVWLNESFARWMDFKTIEAWKPEWRMAEARMEERNRALDADRLAGARRIRQPIRSDDDIRNAFDPITYAKGSEVLTMMERWIGAERFRKGVQRHLAAHAWGNATAEEFFASISAEAGRDVAPAFLSFVDQVGVPLVSVRVVCGGGSGGVLKLAQQRYLPSGSAGTREGVWQIPVCVRLGQEGSAPRQCTLLGAPAAEVPLEPGATCPDRIVPNDAASGYYLSRPGAQGAGPGPALAGLLEDGGGRLSSPERLATLADLSALVSSGDVPIASLLSILPAAIRDGNRSVIEMTESLVRGVRPMVPEDLLPAWRRFVRDTYGEQARAVGLAPAPGEPAEIGLLRPTLIGLMADQGEDEALQAESRRLALAWLDDHRALEASVLDAVLAAASMHGDRALFDREHAAASAAADRTERAHLLAAMSAFQDPRLVEERLPLMLSGEFDPRESLVLLAGNPSRPNLREPAYAFLKSHYAGIAGGLPKEGEAGLASAAAQFCDPAHRTDVAAFFGERTPKAPGGPRVLAQVLERIDLCIARKEAQQASLASFLRGR